MATRDNYRPLLHDRLQQGVCLNFIRNSTASFTGFPVIAEFRLEVTNFHASQLWCSTSRGTGCSVKSWEQVTKFTMTRQRQTLVQRQQYLVCFKVIRFFSYLSDIVSLNLRFIVEDHIFYKYIFILYLRQASKSWMNNMRNN